MNLEVDDSVVIVEGGEIGICVTVSKTSHERERDIYVSYTVLLHSNTSGKNNILMNLCFTAIRLLLFMYSN